MKIVLIPLVLSALVLAQLVTSCAPAEVDLASGLVAYYPLNGGAEDSSGRLNDGVPRGIRPSPDIAGTPGKASSFDGTDSRITLPDGVLARHGSVSVTLWFRTSAGGVMLGYQSTPYPVHPPPKYVPAMYVGVDGHAYGEFWNGDDTPMRSSARVNDGAWHFLALIGDSSTQSMILDGEIAGAMPGVIDHRAMAYGQIGTGNTGVGDSHGWPGGNDFWFGFTGSLDNIRIYDRALSRTECLALYRDKQ